MDFIVGGARLSAEDLKKASGGGKPKPKPRVKDGEAKFMGLRVVGYPPGFIEQARQQHEAGQEEAEFPMPFSIEQFLQSVSPRPASPKLYQLRDAADQCAELARRGGWEHVSVTQVVR